MFYIYIYKNKRQKQNPQKLWNELHFKFFFFLNLLLQDVESYNSIWSS